VVYRSCRLASLITLSALSASLAEDWPQWRGPHRDGMVSASAAPSVWPEHLKLRWKVTVGEGHSSPILAGGRIFVFSRQQDKEIASSIDPESGKIVWQQSDAAPYTMNPAAERHGPGPKSTPVIADGRLYTLGISGVLTCWDAATGAVRWRKEFSKQYRQTSPLYGTAMSPVVDRGLVIAHVGGHDHGALTAFDTGSGEVRWQWTGGNGDAKQYRSRIRGKREIALGDSIYHGIRAEHPDSALGP
jgi:outer membrane protein assembly factor BamB